MKIATILLSIVIFTSCNTAPPKHGETNNSAIAITIGYNTVKVEKIAFIKLNSTEDSLIQNPVQNPLIISEYFYGTWWGNLKSGTTDNFLFDIKPGIYAAVAAYGRINAADYIILFPEKMIKSAIVEVKPNSMVYSGKFYLSSTSHFEKLLGAKIDADNIQKHYYEPVVKGFKMSNSGLTLPHIIVASLEEIRQSSEIEKDFLNDYKSWFKNTVWEEKINNRLKNLE